MPSKQPSEKKRRLSRAERIAIPLIIIIAAWVVYSAMQPSLPDQQPTERTSNPSSSNALDFTLPVIGTNGPTGDSFSLSSLQGKVVFLEFMEPWCTHCQSMAPILGQLHQKYGGNVTFVSVSGPWSGATQFDVAIFMREYGSSWTNVYDSSGSIMSRYGVKATPTFFIIGRDGGIVASLQGEQSYATLESMVIQSLRS